MAERVVMACLTAPSDSGGASMPRRNSWCTFSLSPTEQTKPAVASSTAMARRIGLDEAAALVRAQRLAVIVARAAGGGGGGGQRSRDQENGCELRVASCARHHRQYEPRRSQPATRNP